MQIHLFAIIDGSPRHAVLPRPAGWSVKADRIQSRRRTLTGAYITQFSQKVAAESDAPIDVTADAAQAAIADEIDAGLAADGACFLSDGRHVYQVVPNLALSQVDARGKARISGRFTVVRRVL